MRRIAFHPIAVLAVGVLLGLSTPVRASTTRTKRSPCAATRCRGAAPEPPAFAPRQATDAVACTLAA
jgi:hypothetical protein